MGKKSKRNSGPRAGSRRAELMEKRRLEREQAQQEPVRPFAGLAYECDLVALREFVPSATAALPVRPEVAAEHPITLATVVPGAVAAVVREEAAASSAEDAGTVVNALVGMQVQSSSYDLGADLAAAVLWAAGAEAGETLQVADPSDSTPPVTEVLQPDAPLEITVHKDFEWWLAGGAETNAQVKAAVEQANQLMMPSERIDGVDAAWWVDAGERAHLRWVRPEDEDALMAALARVHAAGGLTLGEGSRFAGTFRAHGLLVPVFDLDLEKHPLEWRDATLELGARMDEALADDGPLTSEQRRSRDGLRGRQVTIR
ncbi:DUF5926 family protein [Tomitella cavernea]|uniref:DUF5926 family protein n=1 Tax=Tomitella cavernea TaxID=1387982 RepID=UPI0019081A19|nr:DUF5926 family protein [Tomitella cavernea]